MKKLLVFTAALALAFVSQAAQLDWALSSKTVTMKSGSNASGVTVYLLGFDSSSAADTYYASLADGSVTLATAMGAALDNTTTATGKSWGSVSKTGTNTAFVEGAYGYYSLLFTETVSGTDYFLLSAAVQGMGYDPSGTVETEGVPASFNASHFGSAETRTGWTAVSTPEPTSGLLLLIGGSLLALRRKQK